MPEQPTHADSMAVGRLALSEGRFREASAAFKSALAARPNEVSALLGVAEAASARGRWRTALRWLRKAEKRRPRRASIRLKTAEVLIRQADFDGAAAAYARAVELKPALYGRLVKLAKGRKDDAAGALAIWSALLRHRPDDLAVLLRKAKSELDLRRLDEAQASFDDAMALAVDCAAAHKGLGDVAKTRGLYRDARRAYSRALELDPGNLRLALLACDMQYRAGELADAHEALDELAKRHPGHPKILMKLGQLSAAAARSADAVDAIERSLAVTPENVRGWRRLAHLRGRESGLTAAMQVLSGAERMIGPRPDFELERARQLFRRGHDGAAADALESGLTQFAGHPDLLMEAALQAIEIGQFRRAEELLAKLPALNGRKLVSRLLVEAKLCEFRRDEDGASLIYERILDISPADARVHLALARAALRRLDLTSAQTWLAFHQKHRVGALLAQGRSLNPSQSLTGAFLNEFQVDRDASRQARNALADDDLDGLKSTVLQHPDQTAPAIALLLGLRRRGAFAKPDQAAARQIPRKILQYWDSSDVPSEVLEMMFSWRNDNPDFQYTRFSDGDAEAYIRRGDDLLVYRAWKQARGAAQKADLLRLVWLWREGGVYVDADDRSKAPIAGLISGSELVLWQESFGSIGNNFIAAAPGHPVIRDALASAVAAIIRGDSESIWFSTGPGLLSRTVARRLAAAPSLTEALQMIQILERHELRALAAPGCRALYKGTARHWIRNEFVRNTG